MKKQLPNIFIGCLISVLSGSYSVADDIDIYFSGSSSNNSAPLVMFGIDWRPNLTSTVCNSGECDDLINDGYLTPQDPNNIEAFEMYRAVLKKVFESLSGIKVGLMVTHDDGNGPSCAGPQTGTNTCSNGGYIPFGFRSLVENDSNGAKADFDNLLGNMVTPHGGKSHKYQGSELFFEFFRYLIGGDIYNGHNGYESFDDNSDDDELNIIPEHVPLASAGDVTQISWDQSIESGAAYISPLTGASTCSKIYTINFIFGTLNSDSDSDNAISDSTANGGLGGINLPNNNNSRFEAILEYLNAADLADGQFNASIDINGTQNVTSYFLVPQANNTENAFARAGGTGTAIELSDNPDEVIEAIENIFKEILSVSTTFVSASVPVNVYNRAEVLDNVFLALFQPQESAVWPGNIKKLKLADDGNGTLILIDAQTTPQNAVSSADGRLTYDALTYWTDSDTLPFPDANVTGDEANAVVDERDGRFVARGGAGQFIAGIPGSEFSEPGLLNVTVNARQLFTQPASGTTLLALNADSATAQNTTLQTALGAGSEDEALCLLKYARGYDVTNITAAGCTDPGTPRSWLVNDLLHSRPIAINYGGSSSNPRIYIVAGSNDGYMRMISNTDDSGNENGKELWAFMPQEVMANVATLAANPNLSSDHPYGIDGAAVAYMVDNDADGNIETDDSDTVHLFFGLRRGGNAYYGLDISDPDEPAYMWTVTNNSSGFSELGKTFSQPQLGYLNWGSGSGPVLIVGGGYDTRKDQLDGSGNPTVYNDDDSVGNAIFVIDASTGDLIWKAVSSGTASDTTYINADLKDSIPSDVVAYDTDINGVTDRAYVGDTGGVVWRIDFTGNNRSNWTVNPILSVGRHAPDGLGNVVDRRFFHAPDLALSLDNTGNFDAVIISSGNRPHPVDESVDNEIYMLKDRNSGTNLFCSSGGAANSKLCTADDLADVTDSSCLDDDPISCDGDLEYGWRLALEKSGEKGLSTPLTLDGTVYFTSYLPPSLSSNQCLPNEGGGLLYAVSLQDATATTNLNVLNDDGGEVLDDTDRTRALLSGGIPAEVVPLPVGKVLDISTNSLTDSAPNELSILAPDLHTEKTSALDLSKTFWYQEYSE